MGLLLGRWGSRGPLQGMEFTGFSFSAAGLELSRLRINMVLVGLSCWCLVAGVSLTKDTLQAGFEVGFDGLFGVF